MRKLPISTVMMGFILALVSPLAFSVDVSINANGEGRCIFLDPDDPNMKIEVVSPDRVKVLLKKGRATATCQDKDVATINGGKPIVFEGYGRSCRIIYGLAGFASGSYEQVSSKNGSTLTCVEAEPQGFPAGQ